MQEESPYLTAQVCRWA